MVSARRVVRSGFVGLMLAVLAGAATPGSASAGLMQADEIVEVMIEAQGADATFIGRQFGPDAATTLRFTSSLDVAARRLSYSLVSGSSYLGEATSLTTTGAFNPVSGLWEWTSVFSRGTSGWTVTGSGFITGDPDFNTFANLNRFGLPPLPPFRRDHHSKGSLVITPSFIESSGEVTFTRADPLGQEAVTGRAFSSDFIRRAPPQQGAWQWEQRPDFSFDRPSDEPFFFVLSQGDSPFPDGGSGSFTVQIQPVPEPSSASLAALGAAGLLGWLWRCRRRPS